MRLIAGANGANLDRKVAINAGRELAVPRCARLIQTPASLLRTLRCDCALRPHFPKALPGLTGRQGRGRITIGAKRRVPPVATSSCFAFFGRSLRRAPRFHRGTFVESARFIMKKVIFAMPTEYARIARSVGKALSERQGAIISEPLPQRLVELLCNLSESETAKPDRRRHAAAKRSRLSQS